MLAVVDAVIGALRRHGIAYFVTGSFASSLHGEFRATNDIDVVADIDASLLPAFVHELDAHAALRVASDEDILLTKLRRYRLGGESSAVQERNARQLIALNREVLDMAYLRQWGASTWRRRSVDQRARVSVWLSPSRRRNAWQR